MNLPRRLALALVLIPSTSQASASEWPKLPADVFVRPAIASLQIPNDVFARPPGDDVIHVVLFGRTNAAVVRARVSNGGEGYRSAWGAFVVRLHAYLDRDGDGTLTTLEANKAPWTQLLQNPFNGGQFNRIGSKPIPIDSAPKDGKVTVEELSAYLRATQSYGELAAQSGAPPDARTEAAFGQLDRDGDKALAASELSDASAIVARLDADEDEIISLDEMTPDRSSASDRFRGVNVGNGVIDLNTTGAAALTDESVIERVAARLLDRYDKRPRGPGAKGSKIGPEAVGADPSAFRAADRNGDGSLDLDELKRYLLDPTPALEIVVNLPRPGQGAGQVVKAARKHDAPKPNQELPTRPGSNGPLVVLFDGTEVELQTQDNLNQPGNFFDQQFTGADADKSGALDLKEARGNFFMQRMFPVADRDGNGKMTLSEMKAYLDRSQDAQSSRVMLTVADLGGALHETIDADRDTRLSLRELRKAYDRLRTMDSDGDGRLTLGELPRRSRLILGRGDVRNNNVVFVANTSANGNNRPGQPPNTPAWFVGMDRNRDGDVSPREFLGSPEHFQLFDTDHDGLIDAAEASKAP